MLDFLLWFSLQKKKQSQIFTKHKSKFHWKNNSQIVPSPFLSTNSNRNCLMKIQTLWKINHLIVSVWKIGKNVFFLPLCSWWLYCLNHSFGLSQMHFGVLNLYVLAWYVLMSMYVCVCLVGLDIFSSLSAFSAKMRHFDGKHLEGNQCTFMLRCKEIKKQTNNNTTNCAVA